MRAFVTGARGFVGGHLARELRAHGAEVIAPCRDELDLLDAEATRPVSWPRAPDQVFHLAATRVGRRVVARAGARRSSNNTRGDAQPARGACAPRRRRRSCSHGGSGESLRPGARGAPAGRRGRARCARRTRTPCRRRPPTCSPASTPTPTGCVVVRTRAFNHAGPGSPTLYVVAAFAKQIADAERAGRPSWCSRPATSRRAATSPTSATWCAPTCCWRTSGEPAIFNVCSGVSVPVADILARLASVDRARRRAAHATRRD